MERIIFDLDGTLISNINFNDYVERAFKDIGIYYTDEDLNNIQKAIKLYEKSTLRYDYNLMLDYFNKFTKLDLDMYFMERLSYHLGFGIEPQKNEELFNTLEYLYKYYDLVVLTNWFKDSQYMRLYNADMLKYFKNVYGAEVYKKPMEEAYLNACGNNLATNTIMVGDSYKYDYLGAKNAGLNAILLDKKNQYNEFTNERINDIKELRKIL